MAKRRDCVSLPAWAYFFHIIQKIILDALNTNNIFSEKYLKSLRGSYSMTNENNKKPGDTTPDPPVQSQTSESKVKQKETVQLRPSKEPEPGNKQEKIELLQDEKQTDEISTEPAILKTRSEIQLRRELLKIYANDAFVGLGIFIIFVVTSIVIYFVARYTGPIGILIKIVGWTISALGAICSINFAIRNACDFIKLLWTGSPKETSHPENAGKGRNG